jgi:hypothetical protein
MFIGEFADAVRRSVRTTPYAPVWHGVTAPLSARMPIRGVTRSRPRIPEGRGRFAVSGLTDLQEPQ